TLKLAGIFAAQPGDPPTVLRFPASSNHQTGLTDCGQGSGTNADAYVVYYGCGPGNPHFTPPLNPLFNNDRNGDCSQPWPAGDPRAWAPLRRFAAFYSTGWDSASKPQCPTAGSFAGNEPFPIKGKQNSQHGAVWGHWTSYVDVLGTGDNQDCPINSVQPINC